MRGEHEEPQWRVWWRVAFAGFLALTLLVGLYLSFRPAGFDDEADLAGQEETTEPAPAGGGGRGAGDGATEQQEPPPGDEPAEGEDEDPDGLSEEEREALMEAARDPAATSVQVLDAGGGESAAADAASVLSDLGYDVVAINAARQSYDQTTVLFTDGNADEAEALRAREDRVRQSSPNELLSDAVDLHVMVGPDW